MLLTRNKRYAYTIAMIDFATEIKKMQEAYAVMHGFPIERKFSDRELEGYQYELRIAETDIREMEEG